MKNIRYFIEYILAIILFKFLQLFSFKISSNIGAFLGKNIMYFVGKILGENIRGLRQISFAFPLKTIEEKRKILKASYESIGRFVAEYINQHKINEAFLKENVEVKNFEKVKNDIEKGCFLITGHFGNWEIFQRYFGIYGPNLYVVYNPLKNPYINKLYLKQRLAIQIPKGDSAIRALLESVKAKKTIGILIDQRDKTGEIFYFFNQEARTSTAIQRLSVKYNYKIIPVICYRKKDNPNKFVMKFFDPLETQEGTMEEQIKLLTQESISVLESFIKENPNAWLLWSYPRWRTEFK